MEFLFNFDSLYFRQSHLFHRTKDGSTFKNGLFTVRCDKISGNKAAVYIKTNSVIMQILKIKDA